MLLMGKSTISTGPFSIAMLVSPEGKWCFNVVFICFYAGESFQMSFPPSGRGVIGSVAGMDMAPVASFFLRPFVSYKRTLW